MSAPFFYLAMHKWTKEEREIVRCDYRGTKGSAEAIARRLGNGITMWAVIEQAGLMGLGGNRSVHRRNGWTPEEEGRLGQLIARYAPKTVAKMMGRSPNSVIVRAKRLGYSRRVRDGWFTEKEACEILGVSHGWLRRQIAAGHLIASWHHGTEPTGKGSAYWHITGEDLKAFIQRYPMELTGRNVDLFTIVDILAGVTTPFQGGHLSPLTISPPAV